MLNITKELTLLVEDIATADVFTDAPEYAKSVRALREAANTLVRALEGKVVLVLSEHAAGEIGALLDNMATDARHPEGFAYGVDVVALSAAFEHASAEAARDDMREGGF